MKKVNQLLLVAADETLSQHVHRLQVMLSEFSVAPVGFAQLAALARVSLSTAPQLVVLLTNLTAVQHLQTFVSLQAAFPHSSVLIAGEEQDEALCLLALEAGADDSVLLPHLSPSYLRKMVLLALRRHQTERTLRQSREQLLACIENTPNVAVQWYNGEGEVLFWNKASERIFGWKAEEALGHTVNELILMPADREYWRQKIRYMAEATTPHGPEEWSFRYRDGSEGCCISTLVPLPSFNGGPVFMCMDVEITDRKRMEQALRESEEKYHNLFNQASDAIFINNLDNQLLDVNERACAMLGYTKEQLLQMRVEDLYSQEELSRLPIMRRELQEGRRTSVDRNIRRADGGELPVEVTAKQLTDGRVMAIVRDVSERKRAAAALERHEQQLALIYNSISDGVFLLDVEEGGRYRYASANQAFFEITGLQYDWVVGRLATDVIPEPSLTLMLRNCAEAIDRRQRLTWEELAPCPKGEKTGVMSVMPVFDKQGRCTQIVGTVYDITERKRAEKALQQSEEKYRSLIEQQADAITIFNQQGQILDVNTSASVLLQYSKDEFRQMTLNDVLDPEEMQTDPVDFALLQTGASTIKQRKMRRRDGSAVTTEVHAKRLFDHLYLASVRDLTERLEAQRQLQKESRLSQDIINSMPGLFYLYQPEVGYLRWNRQFGQISGYSDAELSTMKPIDFFADDEKQKVIDAIAVVFARGENVVEANLLTKSGKKIPYYFTGRALDYDGKPAFLGTAIDLSPLRSLERELAEQRIAAQKKIMQAMLQAEENERTKLGQELHDNVNQLLSVVRLYLTILNSAEPVEEVTLEKTIDLLNQAMEEIRDLSHNLAVRYRFETGLNEALRSMFNKVQAARNFRIHFSTLPELDEATDGRVKLALYRIIQEQLSNIIKYAGAQDVWIGLTINGNNLQLLIADNGKGFDPAATKSGLGLNNITNRAEALNGKTEIFAAPAQGCKVVVTLPLQTPQNPSTGDAG